MDLHAVLNSTVGTGDVYAVHLVILPEHFNLISVVFSRHRSFMQLVSRWFLRPPRALGLSLVPVPV